MQNKIDPVAALLAARSGDTEALIIMGMAA